MNFQQCNQCVMDTSDPNITFDANGVCNHCQEAKILLPKFQFTGEQEKENLKNVTDTIKQNAKGKYDAIIGLSGGVDSSYITHLAKEMGLCPLIVHFDNGWNSEKSVSNIRKIVNACGFDMETYVINWPEFRDLQRSFFKAGVVDIEILSDHAILATMFKIRKKHGIKYVLSGSNYKTEHGMPNAWLWRKQDDVNIKAIQKKFGTLPIKEFPIITSIQFQSIKAFGLGGTYIEILDRLNYSQKNAIEVLQKEYGWEYYGAKHYESVFTKFYQAYVLPVKFGYDKRKVHLSALIRIGEVTREAALQELQQPAYDQKELIIDKSYVLKKLGFTEEEFESIMKEEPVPHQNYPTDQWIFDLWKKIRPLVNPFRPSTK